MTSETYVAEFSPSQCRFHVHTKSDREEAERLSREKTGHPTDYLVLGEFDSHEEATAFVSSSRKLILEKGIYFDKTGTLVSLYTKS